MDFVVTTLDRVEDRVEDRIGDRIEDRVEDRIGGLIGDLLKFVSEENHIGSIIEGKIFYP
jgi:hypothetical protein